MNIFVHRIKNAVVYPLTYASRLPPLKSIENSVLTFSGFKVCHCSWVFLKSINNNEKGYINKSKLFIATH